MIDLNGPSRKKQTLEDKQQEKARLLSKFKAHRRENWKTLTAQEPRLADFKKAIRGAHPRDILGLVLTSWVRVASVPVQHEALRLIDKEASRRVREQGGEPLDDPLPPERNLYLLSREIFALR